MRKRTIAAIAPIATLAGLSARDLMQKDHALRRNFPIVARLRYFLESIGPELRQYIVSSNDAERPFSRDQRRWGVRLREEGEQLLRLRHRQRHGKLRLSHHQAADLR
ncbi:hypothetical protein [Granulicoccus sp. GXG6511]|uniref:hypothetical protein n=1 Tax=Granulicoccus sp. GXG6511 TaxID=3381351 RepID=UPI003D7E35DB